MMRMMKSGSRWMEWEVDGFWRSGSGERGAGFGDLVVAGRRDSR